MWTKVGEKMPAPHNVYRVWTPDSGQFDATVCYGMHKPWWVPRNGYTNHESDPVNMLNDHYWMEFPKPPNPTGDYEL